MHISLWILYVYMAMRSKSVSAMIKVVSVKFVKWPHLSMYIHWLHYSTLFDLGMCLVSRNSFCLWCVCMGVWPPPRLVQLVTWYGVIWTQYNWLIKFYSFLYGSCMGSISRCGLRIELRHRYLPNKSKLALCKLWIHFSISVINMCVCGIHGYTCTLYQSVKKKTGFGYRLTVSGYW